MRALALALLAPAMLAACQNIPDSVAANMANTSAPTGRAYIAFADLPGSIRGWSEDEGSLLIEATGGRWYRAELFSPCLSLRFSNAIGFVTDPMGRIDRFSSIVTDDGERCWFKTFEALPGAPERPGRVRSTE